MLHSLCDRDSRPLHTVEHDADWMQRFRSLENEWHTFEHVPLEPHGQLGYEIRYRLSSRQRERVDGAWESVGRDGEWGLVFIDHLPAARRVKEVARLREAAKVFVIHNTDRRHNAIFGFWPYLSSFRYVYEFPAAPATVICSDSIDVTDFVL